MRSKSMVAAGAMVLVAAGAFAGISLAGNGTQSSDARVKVLKPVTAVASPDGAGGSNSSARATRKKKPTIQFFYAATKSVPAEGSGVVTALRCPKGKGEPIAGGAQTDIGIVVSYLSRVKPGTNQTPARTYYVGVDDNDGAAGAGARVEIQCAKDIAVEHG